MPDTITLEEFDYLNDLYHSDIKKFNEVIMSMLDIESKFAITYDYYDYYDYYGNYIGNTNDSSLHDILYSAYIKIRG